MDEQCRVRTTTTKTSKAKATEMAQSRRMSTNSAVGRSGDTPREWVGESKGATSWKEVPSKEAN